MKQKDTTHPVSEIILLLKKEYPSVRTALHFTSPLELLIATILSAQTTDVHVNKVTERLFKKYKTAADYAGAPVDELAEDIRTVNFYRNKAKNITATAAAIAETFHGQVPKTMEDLITLPGVARKTANVVLFGAFGINEGIAVDTHVKRLANRLGLTAEEDPVKIERDLMAMTPRKEWGNLASLLIFHGRNVCDAKKPLHEKCVLYDLCPSRSI